MAHFVPFLFLQLDKEYFSTATVCKLSAWEGALRRDLAKRLTRGTWTAYDRMMSAISASDPTMEAVIENLLLTGEPCKLMHQQCSCSNSAHVRWQEMPKAVFCMRLGHTLFVPSNFLLLWEVKVSSIPKCLYIRGNYAA